MNGVKGLILPCIILLFLVIVAIYYIINVFRLLFSKTKKAPYIPSFNRQLQLMKNLDLEEDAIMVDLGCGDGKALRFFSKEYRLKLGEGFDINPYAIFKGKLLNKRYRVTNIYLYKKNLFDVDLKKYDYIYVYLWETQLEMIEDWVWKEKKKNAVIISNSFRFKKHKPFKVYKNKQGVDTVFLYK